MRKSKLKSGGHILHIPQCRTQTLGIKLTKNQTIRHYQTLSTGVVIFSQNLIQVNIRVMQ
uniref:Uncharacterized protein n=1 Tax=Manihot esculenta TaxID=3983 RepID=A0A2C9UDU4_MANES